MPSFQISPETRAQLDAVCSNIEGAYDGASGTRLADSAPRTALFGHLSDAMRALDEALDALAALDDAACRRAAARALAQLERAVVVLPQCPLRPAWDRKILARAEQLRAQELEREEAAARR